MESRSRALPQFAQLALALVVAVAVGLVILPFEHPAARLVSESAPILLVTLFAAGLLALATSHRRLMETAFVGAVAVALVLRGVGSGALYPGDSAASGSRSLSVAQYSTQNLALVDPGELESLRRSSADVLSVQELTDEWATRLSDKLGRQYPYQYLFPAAGLRGIGLFSKFPLGAIDTFEIGGLRHIDACVSGDATMESLHIVSAQRLPSESSWTLFDAQAQLRGLAQHVRSLETPAVIVGDFNAAPWSTELVDFVRRADLRDSRTQQVLSSEGGLPRFFEVPVEHIFYTADLRCLGFRNHRGRSGYLGNGATFQNESPTSPVVAL